MVIILNDKLLHLADCVVVAAVHVAGDVGDFSPENKTCLVAKVVEFLCVLIVCKTDCGCTNLKDKV